jgi:hypothetical protein
MGHRLLFLPLLVLPALGQTARIDFGLDSQETAEAGWNHLSGTVGADPSPASLVDIVDSAGMPTAWDVAWSESGDGQSGVAGTGANYAGPYPAGLAGLPEDALKDGHYLQNGNQIELTFSDLDPSSTYDFVIYGARGNNGSETIYTANGNQSGSIASVFNNGTTVVFLPGVSPTPGGVIEVIVTAPAAGSTSAGTINMLQITAKAAIVIESAGFRDGAFEVAASGLALESRYQLVRSADLVDGFPVIVDGPRAPLSTSDVFGDSSPPGGMAFYRIEEVP